jgi:hypothetical protein
MLSKLALLGAVQAGKCPFGFDKETTESSHSHPRVRSDALYPSEIFPCGDG